MQVIWKFPVHAIDWQTIAVPFGCRFLSVQEQDGVGCIWVQLDETAKTVALPIWTFGTGHPLPRLDDKIYLGTYQLPLRALVFHVYRDLFPGEGP